MSKKANLLLVLLLSCCILNVQARQTFIRVYNLEGHRIDKGSFVSTTDSSVIIQHGKKQIEIPVRKIGFIKTGRSAGAGAAVGAGIGVLLGGIIGVASGGDSGGGRASYNGTNPFANVNIEFSPIDTGLAGALLGGIGGAGLGALISLAKKRTVIQVNGGTGNWQKNTQQLISPTENDVTHK